MPADLDALVARFLEAYATGRPIKLVSRELDLSTDEAYDVQDRLVDHWCTRDGAMVHGYKISVTSSEAQAGIDTDEPTYGTFTNAHVLPSPAEVSLNTLFRPLLEMELVFLFDEDLSPGAGPEEIRAKARVAAGFEIPDSRYEHWYPDPELTVVDLVADNSVAGRLVVAAPSVPASALDLSTVAAVLRHDDEVVTSGTSSAVLGNPLVSVAWLADRLAKRGRVIGAGMVVSSGTFTVPVIVGPGSYEAAYGGVGSVRVTFAP